MNSTFGVVRATENDGSGSSGKDIGRRMKTPGRRACEKRVDIRDLRPTHENIAGIILNSGQGHSIQESRVFRCHAGGQEQESALTDDVTKRSRMNRMLPEFRFRQPRIIGRDGATEWPEQRYR